MKKLRNIIILGAMYSFVMAVFGCSMGAKNITEDETFNIERIDSKSAFITEVAVFQADSELSVWGSVQRNRSGRANVKGHIDAYWIDEHGNVLAKKIVPFYRMTQRKGNARFKFDLKLLPEPNRILRIVHHDSPVHDT